MDGWMDRQNGACMEDGVMHAQIYIDGVCICPPESRFHVILHTAFLGRSQILLNPVLLSNICHRGPGLETKSREPSAPYVLRHPSVQRYVMATGAERLMQWCR